MEKLEKKNLRKGIIIVCFVATIVGICYYVAKPRTTRTEQNEVRQIVEPRRESQAKPETKTTTTEETNKVDATQPEVESYNDSIAPTYENERATEATTTGSNTNKVVVEDNSKAVAGADEEIREAQDNGATVVESEETGVTAVSESQPAVEEKDSTQQIVDLDFSSAVDAVNEK